MVLAKRQRAIIQEMIRSSTVPFSTLRHELKHALNVLEWVEAVRPNAPASIRYAALLHDCDRLFPDHRARKEDFPTYELYKRAHAKNCARLAEVLLKRAGIAQETKNIRHLIEDHEWGSTPSSYLLMSADSLSFFTVNVMDYFKKHGGKATAKKISFMYERLKQKERNLLLKADLPFKQIPPLYHLFKTHIKKVTKKERGSCLPRPSIK